MGLLEGKVALITGGASGLGRTMVKMFVEEGAEVVFTYRTSSQKARELTEQYGSHVLSVRADASSDLEAKCVAKKTIERFGRIDILINNAASAVGGAFVDLELEDFKTTVDNVFYPVVNYSSAVVPYMIDQQEGVIVSIGSINGERGREGSSPYCAAKAAIEGLSKTMAKELGGDNIRCNVVAPGYIATDGQSKTSLLIQKMVLDECAIRKLTKPEEVANLVIFLASDKGKNITGQIYRIDCGQYI